MQFNINTVIKTALIIGAVLALLLLSQNLMDKYIDKKMAEKEAIYQAEIKAKDNIISKLYNDLDSSSAQQELLRDTMLMIKQGLHRKEAKLDSLKNWQDEAVNRARRLNSDDLTRGFSEWEPR